MNIIKIIGLVLLISACTRPSVVPFDVTSMNEDWIIDGDTLSIPHTPQIEPLIVNDQWQGNLTYLKNLTIDDPQLGKTFLHFEGVMHDATVFINDVKIKRHVGGYLPFSVDITDHLRKGENQIRIEVSNTDDPTIPPGKPLEVLDFNYYGGIYRDVWLIRKNEIYVTDPFIEDAKEAGWLLHFDEVSTDQATGVLKIQLKNESNSDKEVSIRATFKKGDFVHSFEEMVQMESLEVKTTSLAIDIQNPILWSTISPNLYQLSIEVNSNNGTYDLVEDKVGIRQIELNDEGFFLNGEKQFIRGTNRHQEYPYVGYAISNNANFRDALKIKSAGFDFVRLSHYPQDEAFLDACDELGILVMNAIPGWQFFQEGEFVVNSYQDIKDMVRRDRNHPSVIFWEVSLNESGMTPEYMEKANQILKEELPFSDTYSAGWIDHPSYDLFIPARQHAGPPNYWNDYKNGERKVFIGEYGDWEYYAHNAGFNQTEFADLSEDARNSRQLRSSGERGLLQQALNFQEAANSNRNAGKGTIGHANWLMFDYNRGYADDLEASGISDIFRIPKFAYYFYKSQRPFNEIIDHPLIESGPMVKIASYWTEKSTLDIRVFSNCEEVALYLNDSLIEKKSATINELSNELISPPFHFDLARFEAGEIIAKGFIDGELLSSDTVRTPGQPNNIQFSIDTAGISQNETDDFIFIYANVVDSMGTLLPNFDGNIFFKNKGGGEILGQNPTKAEAGIATILYRGNISDLDISAQCGELRASWK